MYYYSTSIDWLLIAAAVIPALFLLHFIYKHDSLEREPIGMLISLVLFGVFSTEIAILLEQAGFFVLDRIFYEDSLPYLFISNFLIVGLAEELSKYVLLKKRTWKSPHFNCSFDGVVYATFVSLGFALWENISYVLMYGFGTALLRAVTAVPGHTCFGIFMGTWYGAAKRYENAGDSAKAAKYRKLSLIIPVCLHGAYDFLATIEGGFMGLSFYPFMIAMFIISYTMVKRLSASDQFISPSFQGMDGAFPEDAYTQEPSPDSEEQF